MQWPVAALDFAAFNLLFVSLIIKVLIPHDRNTLTHQGWRLVFVLNVADLETISDHGIVRPPSQTRLDQTPPKEAKSPKKRVRKVVVEV